MLQKPKRLNYMMVRSYWVISLLNFLGEVCEKVVVDLLAKWYKINHVLHECQMRLRRRQSAIDAVAMVISWEQEAWTEGRLVGMSLMDVKVAFNYVSRSCLLLTIETMAIESDLMRWTESFMSDRSMRLLNDEH